MAASGVPLVNAGIERKGLKRIAYIVKKDKALLLLILPGLLAYIVFRYVPMYGVLMAFQDYKISKGILQSPWVYFDQFKEFFTGYDAWKIIRNTFLLSIYSLLWGFPIPVVFALLLNELKVKTFKNLVQTVSYLPHFISTVIVVGLVVNLLDYNNGVVNNILVNVFGMKQVNFLIEPAYFRTIYVSMNVWKDFGWGSIIYLAAITGIDTTLYEAAIIDGANRFKQMLHVTLPGIIPVATIMLILNLGRILDVGFESVILLYKPLTYETADIISTYVYRRGLIDMDFSFATAVGLFQSVIGLVFIVSANKLARRFSETSLW